MSEPTPEQKAEQWMETFGERLAFLIDPDSDAAAIPAAYLALVTMVAETAAWRVQAEPLLRALADVRMPRHYSREVGISYIECPVCGGDNVSDYPHMEHKQNCIVVATRALLGEGGQ